LRPWEEGLLRTSEGEYQENNNCLKPRRNRNQEICSTV
jgi:hypothetical protein